jgi:hypothetical protein
LTVGQLRSLRMSELGTYHGASTIMRKTLYWNLSRISMFEVEAVPHSCIRLTLSPQTVRGRMFCRYWSCYRFVHFPERFKFKPPPRAHREPDVWHDRQLYLLQMFVLQNIPLTVSRPLGISHKVGLFRLKKDFVITQVFFYPFCHDLGGRRLVQFGYWIHLLQQFTVSLPQLSPTAPVNL